MKISIISFVLILSGSVIAQTSGSLSTRSVEKDWVEKITPDRISHFSIINGPAVDGSSNPNNFDGTEDTGGMSSWHQVSFGYKIAKGTRLVINPHFVLNRSEVDSEGTIGKLDNPVIGITSTWYENGNFTFSGGLNTVFAVLDEEDRENGLEWNPGGFQTMNYKINNTTNVGLWLWGRYRYFRNNGEKSRFPIMAAPFVSYDINDKINTMAFYEAFGRNDNVDDLIWDNDEALNFMVGYRVTDKLTVSPMLTVYRDTDFDVQQGNIKMWVSGRFL